MLISLGTVLRYADQWWTVDMIGITGGERYYWLTRDNEVAMIPAFMIEIPVVKTTHTESDKA